MQRRIRDHIRANVIGYVALFLALTGGVAWANHPGGANTITSGDIVNGEVKSGDIGDLEVKAADIAADSLGSGKIANQSVKNADLGLGASSSNTIADGGIQGVDVQNHTLTGAKIDEGTLFNDNSLTGADVDEATLAGLWRFGGNAGTGAADFLGTTDNQPLNLGVDDAPALRLEPAVNSVLIPTPNLVGGSPGNTVAAGVHGATIAGGGPEGPEPIEANQVTDNFGTVGGGAFNHVGDSAGTVNDRRGATIGGGMGHAASGEGATIGGGFGNLATGFGATVGGGGSNIASGQQATVAGGNANFAEGDFSLAGGDSARAEHDGAFVWADSTGSIFSSTADNQFSVRSLGGARFVSALDPVTGDPSAGVELAPGGGSWSSLSDAAAKRAVEPVSGREVLRSLASVPISTWSYRSQEDSIRHIGPMAQDFYRAFGVGEDRRHIASVDADGVALAAVKGLNRKLTAKVDRLEQRLASLERRLGSAR